MKILLVYPYFLDPRPKDYDVRPLPIGLYYIAAFLKEKGYKVDILNWYQPKDPIFIKNTFLSLRPDVIAFSIFNANRWGAIEVASIAKEILPKTPIILGGVGATFLWEHFLKHFPAIDYIVLGEGEHTFWKLLQHIENSAPSEELFKIKGIAFRKNGNPFCTGEAGFLSDIDTLPDPAKYFTFQHVVSSRGCPWNCIFCGSPRFWKRKVRFHSSAYFLEQLERLYRKGINFFYVSDDTFTLKKERVIQICEGILKRNLKITWQAISRVDCIDEEILYWMRRAGCLQISFGVESGDEHIRNQVLNKKIPRQAIKKAFKLCRKYGILPRAYFIYGSPGENKKTIQATIKMIKEIKPLSMVCYILDLYPGTALYEKFKKTSGASDDLWLKKVEDIMYHEIDPSLSVHKVRKWGKKIHQTFYKNLPKFIESLHLIDKNELYPYHADFLTRLAMTLYFGEYSQRPEIPQKEEEAQKLFLKALQYYPDHHAYLGLGIIYQRKKQWEESIKILEEGLKHYPRSEHLNICQAVNLIQQEKYQEALKHLEPFFPSPEALKRAALCYEALGKREKAYQCLKLLKSKK